MNGSRTWCLWLYINYIDTNHPRILRMKTPKRTYRKNIYGNIVGYESGRRVYEFGCQPWSERQAAAWCEGLSIENAELKAHGLID